MRWQKITRAVILVGAIGAVVVVVRAFKKPAPASAPAPVVRTDPGAVVETTGGRVERFKSSRSDVRVDYKHQLTFADGSTKLVGVTITTDDRGGGRNFVVTGNEAQVGDNDAAMTLTGDVKLKASDGLTLQTEKATYSDKDGVVAAPEAATFSRGRMTGSGTGMTYDTGRDVLVVMDQAKVHVKPDGQGNGAIDVVARRLELARREKFLHFEEQVKVVRAGQIVQSDVLTAHLTDDEQAINAMELRGHSQIRMAKPVPGGLQTLGASDIDLKYAADGETLEHATLLSDAAIFLAGEKGSPGRQVTAKTIDIGLGPDGATPTLLVAREAVQLLLPAEGTLPMRTIRSASMRADGEAGRGLTAAEFTGGSEYRERGQNLNRVATSATLNTALKPGMSGIDDAMFTRNVRFVDGDMTAVSASARYNVDAGSLLLTGSEPAIPRPHVVNERISVDADTVDVVLTGPKLKASGTVKSVLQPSRKGRGANGSSDAKLPSLFKQDKPINVTADGLDYDGGANHATYTGSAQLWQEDTSIKGATIVLDDKTGDLVATSAASGVVATVTMLEDTDKDKKVQRVRSVATSKDFKYEDRTRRATYTGTAHLTNANGDLTADKIELYLKTGQAGGDEIERTEAYEAVTLKTQNPQKRTVTGSRLTYTTADQRYVITGAPMRIIDECQRQTIGRTLTYLKDSEITTIDGNDQTRTQTTGSGNCP